MSTWTRNTEGLTKSVELRVRSARVRAERAIEALLCERRPVNFNSVSARARVTRAYLYSQPALRERIVRLRSR